MPPSRKSYRVPSTLSSAGDSFSTTTETSSSTLPAPLRNHHSDTSFSPVSASSHSKMPSLEYPPQTLKPNEVVQDDAGEGPSSRNVSSRNVSTQSQPASKNHPIPLTNYASDRPFPCTFQGCKKIFKTKKDLVKHKMADEEGHDYCKICDLDFEDDDSLHRHKVASEKHICCPICSEDFKSDGGRDRHFTQMHAAEQNINCRGCGKHFLKGAALMSHIENNKCPMIGVSDFQTQRAIVANNMHMISNEEKEELGLMSFRHSTVGESSVGGVAIASSILDDEEPAEDLNMNMPSLSRVLSNGSSATSTASVAQTKAYHNSYPALGSEPKSKAKSKMSSTPGPMSAQEGGAVAETWAKHNFPNAPNTPVTADWKQDWKPESNSGYINTTNAANGKHGHFRLADIKRDPVDGHYHCPFDGCSNGVFPTFELICNHLNSGYHRGVENRCVGCLRRFKSPSALTAHMESNSARCQVRDSRQFGNALSLVSGGYLGVNGRHADGTVKIDTPEAPIPYTPRW